MPKLWYLLLMLWYNCNCSRFTDSRSYSFTFIRAVLCCRWAPQPMMDLYMLMLSSTMGLSGVGSPVRRQYWRIKWQEFVKYDTLISYHDLLLLFVGTIHMMWFLWRLKVVVGLNYFSSSCFIPTVHVYWCL